MFEKLRCLENITSFKEIIAFLKYKATCSKATVKVEFVGVQKFLSFLFSIKFSCFA